jgi:hypothetical protein
MARGSYIYKPKFCVNVYIWARICICYGLYIEICTRCLNSNQWLIRIPCGLTNSTGVIPFERLNQFLRPAKVLCAMCPSAEAVRGWRALNRPTVCTDARLCTGLGSLRLNERVSQV